MNNQFKSWAVDTGLRIEDLKDGLRNERSSRNAVSKSASLHRAVRAQARHPQACGPDGWSGPHLFFVQKAIRHRFHGSGLIGGHASCFLSGGFSIDLRFCFTYTLAEWNKLRTIQFLPRNWTTKKLGFVLRFPKILFRIHKSFVSSIALAFLHIFS